MANKTKTARASTTKPKTKKVDAPVDYSKPLKNPRYEQFSQAYMATNNETQAAKDAKYSPKTAYSKGNQLLKIVEIKGRVEYLQKQLADDCGVTAKMLMDELKKVGFSNIDDYLRIDDKGNVIGRGFDTIDRSKLAAIESIKQTTNITSNKDGERECETRNFTFKLHSKLTAIQDMGKMIGAYGKDNMQRADAMTRLLDRIDGNTRGLPG